MRYGRMVCMFSVGWVPHNMMGYMAHDISVICLDFNSLVCIFTMHILVQHIVQSDFLYKNTLITYHVS